MCVIWKELCLIFPVSYTELLRALFEEEENPQDEDKWRQTSCFFSLKPRHSPEITFTDYGKKNHFAKLFSKVTRKVHPPPPQWQKNKLKETGEVLGGTEECMQRQEYRKKSVTGNYYLLQLSRVVQCEAPSRGRAERSNVDHKDHKLWSHRICLAFGVSRLTCRNFAIASAVMKSPFWNLVTKHITWYWLWPRSSSPRTRAFSTWTSCKTKRGRKKDKYRM